MSNHVQEESWRLFSKGIGNNKFLTEVIENVSKNTAYFAKNQPDIFLVVNLRYSVDFALFAEICDHNIFVILEEHFGELTSADIDIHVIVERG